MNSQNSRLTAEKMDYVIPSRVYQPRDSGDYIMPERMKSKIKVLILGEDSVFTEKISNLLADKASRSANIIQVIELHYALSHLDKHKPEIIFASLNTENVIAAIKDIREANSGIPIIALGRKGDEHLAMEAIKSGVQDCIFFESLEDQNLYQTVQFAIERRRIATDIDKAHRDQLKSVIESASDGVMILSAAKKLIFANPAAEHILESPTTEFINSTPPIPFELGEKLTHTLDLGERKKHLEISTSVLPWDDGGVGFCVTIHDITEHKLLQERLERASALKDEFIAHMSHELRTPMNGIVGMTSLLQESALDKHQQEWVKTIRKSSDNMLEMISDLLDLSKIEAGRLNIEKTTFNLKSLIEDTFDLFAAEVQKKGIILSNFYPSHISPYIQSDSSRLRQIIVNLLSNAIRHTDHGYVSVETDIQDNKLLIVIRDSGIGISKSAQKHLFKPFTQLSTSPDKRQGGTGLGLVICKKLAKLLDGDVSLQNSTKSGSTFSIAIPTLVKNSVVKPSFPDSKIYYLTKNDSIIESFEKILIPLGFEVLNLEDCSPDESKLIIVDSDYDPSSKILGNLSKKFENASILVLANQQQNQSLGEYPCFTILKTPIKQSQIMRLITELYRSKLPNQARPDQDRSLLHCINPQTQELSVSGRALVAEDNKTNQKVIASMLERIGLQVDTVANGREAVESCKILNYDCILMDCRMPVLNGFKATKLIRSISDHYEDIPVIAVTADALKNIKEKCKSAGMDGYLLKPIDLNALRQLIRSKLVDHSTEFFSCEKKDDSGLLLVDEEVLGTLVRVGKKCGSELLHDVVEIFKKEFPQILAELENAEKQKDLVENLAHKLKGSARNIGARRLANKCNEIEEAAASGAGNLDFSLEIFEIKECFNEVCAFLNNYLERVNCAKVG